MPHILKSRADIPDGVLQITDLKPNQSQKNNVLEPAPGQTGYVSGPSNQDVATLNPSGSIEQTANEFVGLSAYLIERVEDQVGGTPALTSTIANDTATLVLARVAAGGTVTAANVAADIVTSGADGATTLSAGNSYGTIADILQILSGRLYTLPQGTEVQATGGTFVVSNAGSFGTLDGFVETLDTGSLKVSFGDGQLSVFSASTFDYLGTAGAAAYITNDDGTLFTV